MAFLLHILTIVFTALKLTEVIDWSWWWVLSPSIFAFATATFFIIAYIVTAIIVFIKS